MEKPAEKYRLMAENKDRLPPFVPVISIYTCNTLYHYALMSLAVAMTVLLILQKKFLSHSDAKILQNSSIIQKISIPLS